MIKMTNVVKCYPDGDNKIFALNEVSVDIEKDDFAVILGPSGSGKSTLINVMSALDKCDFGKVYYNDEVISDYKDKKLTEFRRRNVGFIFQSYYLLPDLDIANNIRMGAHLTGNKEYQDIIEALELKDMLKRMPYQLSGGQQQRVAIARALAKKPQVLFCDEPTGALDEKTGKQVLALLQKYQKEHKIAIAMVTHNLGIADMATKVIKMNSGKIVEVFKNDNPISAKEVRWV